MKKGFLCLMIIMIAATATSYAQGCSVCTKTAAELGDKGAKGMNNGILYLATFPLAILGTVGFIWWKHQKVK